MSNRALVLARPPTSYPDPDDDATSIYTASSISPGSSISARSAQSGYSALTRASGSQRSSESGRSSQSGRSYGSRSSASTRSSEYTYGSDARSRMTSAAPPPAYDGRLMAIYLTELLDKQRCSPTSVKQFLAQNANFGSTNVRPHLDAMSSEAFDLFRKRLQHTHRKLVEQMKRGRSYEIDPLTAVIGDEWDNWRPRGRGQAARRPSLMQYEEVVSRSYNGQMTFTRTFSYSE